MAAFRNWPLVYAERWGLLRSEFVLRHRSGLRVKLRPDTDDLKIVKSNFITRHYVREFVPIEAGAVVVGVGAQIGSFTLLASRTAGKVLAFEPEPGNFRMLKANVALNGLTNVTVFETAVCGRSGERALRVIGPASTGSHSLLPLDGGGTATSVRAVSLAEVMEREGLRRIDFLKLDCEGAEHEILGTLSPETARSVLRLAIETHRVPPETSIDIPGRLRDLGYEVRMEQDGAYVYARRREG